MAGWPYSMKGNRNTDSWVVLVIETKDVPNITGLFIDKDILPQCLGDKSIIHNKLLEVCI